MGWKCIDLPLERPNKSIVCVAPHTSNQDFFIGKLYYWAIGRPSGFMMKKDWFFFPLGCLLRAMGGIPIDRSRQGDTVGKVADFISARTRVHIGITPEGTRSYVERWHTGFYRIALLAGIPIELATIDYSKREVGIFEVFHPTGDLEQDLGYIRTRFASRQAKYPNKFYDYNP